MRDAPPLSPSAALRYEVIRSVLDAHRIRSLVEVGPGMGAMAWRIGTDREYHGYEPDGRSFAVAAQRLRGLPNANLYNQPLPVEPTLSVDALVAFEVLEHLEDDASALARWTKWIRPGGLVLLSVPAHQHRFGPWDEAVGHFRRYGKSEFAAKLEAAGLVEGEVRAYGMPAGYVLEWVRQRVLARRLGEVANNQEGTLRSGRAFQPAGSWGGLVELAMAPCRELQKPFAKTELGTGWIAWAKRPS